MTAEDGGLPTQIGIQAEGPVPFHDRVYGKHFPPAEHFYAVQGALNNLHGVYDGNRDAFVSGDATPDVAQGLAGRLARLELAFRGFARSADINPTHVINNILIGRDEKYTEEWEAARTEIIARTGEETYEPSVEEIKTQCREWWGKWQLELTPDQQMALMRGRTLFKEELARGVGKEDAIKNAAYGLAYEGDAVIYEYETPTGRERILDLSKYFDTEANLVGIVESSQRFEQMTGQAIDGSMRQLDGEFAEVGELHSFFDLKPGQQPTDPAEIIIKFASIDEFHRHVDEQALGGIISEGERDRYLAIGSLEELHTYIQNHLVYESLDVLFAAAGIVHRSGADVAVAYEDALADREHYAEVVVPIIHKELDGIRAGEPITPRFAAAVRRVAATEDHVSELDPDVAVRTVAAIFAQAMQGLNQPQQHAST